MNIDTDCLQDVESESDNLLSASNCESSSTGSVVRKNANFRMARAAAKQYHSVKSPEKRPKGYYYLKLEIGQGSPKKEK